MYITIDPGTNLGWAIWNALGLVACGLDDPRSSPKHIVTSVEPDVDVIHDAWIEDQVIYPRSPVPPGDILTLAKGAHRFAGRYDACGVVVHFVEPSTWKGQIQCNCSKTITFAACRHHARTWSALNPHEQEIVHKALKGVAPSKRHNVLDALGIGLWVRRFGNGGRLAS